MIIGRGSRIDSHAVIKSFVKMGEENRIFPFAVVGEEPQHTGYGGEETKLLIGNRNRFREFVTLHRGTVEGGGVTTIGDGSFLMAYSHVAHDCRIGDGVIVANAVQMGGHTHIEDYALVGGLTAIHQYVRVGAHSMVGGASAVAQDVPPYTMAAGNRAVLHGLNLVGLKRRGFDPCVVSALKRAYRIIFRDGLTIKEAEEKVREVIRDVPEVEKLLEFISSSGRGVCR